MEISDQEKEILQDYSNNFVEARHKAMLFEGMIKSLVKVALFARGLSPETHLIDEKGVILEIKQSPIQDTVKAQT